MSVILIPNQNVVFFDGQDFNARNKQCTWDARSYCQPVQYDTATQFQVRTTGITGFNLVTNGNFNTDLSGWTVGANGGWTWSSQQARFVSNSNTSKTLSQSWITVANTMYRVCFQINGFIDGQRNPGIAIASVQDSGGNTIPLSGGTGQIDANSPVNTEICFFFLAVDATTTLFFTSTDIIQYNLDNVTISEYSTVELLDVTVEDCDGNFEKDVDDVVVIGDTTTITVDWTDLLAGCHRICITGIGDTEFNFLLNGAARITEDGGTRILTDGGIRRWV